VTVGTDPATSVHVLGPDEHPSQDFYDSQDLTFDPEGVDPTDGYMLTRDCTPLSYRVELPDGPMPPGGYDVLVMYSGYTPGVRYGYEWVDAAFDPMTAAGYAVVGVNMRGTGCSGGAFDLMEQLALLDGYDVIETVAAQDWADDVAMYGGSWAGLSQFFVASTRPPSLAAIAPGVPVGDFYRDVVHPGGIENIGFAQIWARWQDSDNAYPSTNPGVINVTDRWPSPTR
jgi:putative CocE/NonD family hydrolase